MPSKIQATKSLILKAVADAQKSVTAHPPKVVEPENQSSGPIFTRGYRERLMNREKVAITIRNSSVVPYKSEESSMMEVDTDPRVNNDENITHAETASNYVEQLEQVEIPDVEPRVIKTRFIVTLEGANSFMSQRFEDAANEDAMDASEMVEPKEDERKPVKSRLYRRRSTGILIAS